MSVNGGSLKQFVMVSINDNNGVRKNEEKKTFSKTAIMLKKMVKWVKLNNQEEHDDVEE